MEPTRKPHIMHKSNVEQNRPTNESSDHKRKFTFLEGIEGKPFEFLLSPPRQDHPLYSEDKDLASSFSFSEEDN